MSVRAKITTTLIIVVILVLPFITVIRASQIRSSHETQASERLHGSAEMVIALLDTTRNSTESLLSGMADLPQVRSAALGMEPGIANLTLRALYNAFLTDDVIVFYDNFLVFDANFDLVASANPTDIRNANDTPFHTNVERTQQGLPAISNSKFCNITNVHQIWISTPIMDGNIIHGMIVIPINTPAFSILLKDALSRANESFINIVDSSGIIFYSNRVMYVGRTVYDLGVLQEHDGNIPMNTIFYHRSWITGRDKIAYITMYDEDNVNWTIVNFFDSHVFPPVSQTIISTLLPALAGIILASLIIIFIVSHSLKPLETLAKSAEEVAQGNIQIKIPIDRKDEIGKVARSFMAVVDSLKLLLDRSNQAEFEIKRGAIHHSIDSTKLGGAFGDIITKTTHIIDQMRGYLDYITDPVMIMDNNFKLMFANKIIKSITNQEDEDVKNMHINSFLNGDISNHPAIIKAFKEGIVQREIPMQESLNTNRMMDLEISCVPIKDGKNKVVAVMLMINNMTHVKEAQRKIEKISDYRRHLTEDLTHTIATAFEQGDLNILMPYISYDDEDTKDIANEFKQMSKILLDGIGTIKSYLDELQATLGNMSKKNFDQKIERYYIGDFYAIKSSINRILKNMNGFFSELYDSSTQTKIGSNIIDEGVQEMQISLNKQVTALNEVNNSIGFITREISQNKKHAQEATRLSNDAKEDAELGTSQMEDMLAAMKEIKVSSNTIAKVINTIQDIAFQTNLLALNASVEAVRAGEHGKGFAVVAEEVRTLAIQSASAVTASTEMIENSILKVNSGVRIAENTSVAFTKIVEAIANIDNVISDITDSSAKQETVIKHIKELIVDVGGMIEVDTQITTRNAETTNELSKRAETLQQMISEFKLGSIED